MSYNKLKALEGNIEAISTALAIPEERRNATTAEREMCIRDRYEHRINLYAYATGDLPQSNERKTDKMEAGIV